MFKLDRRVDGDAFTIVSILVEDTNNGTFIRLENTSNTTKWEILHFSISNSLNIYKVRSALRENPNVTTTKAAISTSINQG